MIDLLVRVNFALLGISDQLFISSARVSKKIINMEGTRCCSALSCWGKLIGVIKNKSETVQFRVQFCSKRADPAPCQYVNQKCLH